MFIYLAYQLFVFTCLILSTQICFNSLAMEQQAAMNEKEQSIVTPKCNPLVDLCISTLTGQPALLIKALKIAPDDMVIKILGRKATEDQLVNECLVKIVNDADLERACLVAYHTKVGITAHLCERLTKQVAANEKLSRNVINLISFLLCPYDKEQNDSDCKELTDAVLKHPSAAATVAEIISMQHMLKLRPCLDTSFCFVLGKPSHITGKDILVTFGSLKAKTEARLKGGGFFLCITNEKNEPILHEAAEVSEYGKSMPVALSEDGHWLAFVNGGKVHIQQVSGQKNMTYASEGEHICQELCHILLPKGSLVDALAFSADKSVLAVRLAKKDGANSATEIVYFQLPLKYLQGKLDLKQIMAIMKLHRYSYRLALVGRDIKRAFETIYELVKSDFLTGMPEAEKVMLEHELEKYFAEIRLHRQRSLGDFKNFDGFLGALEACFVEGELQFLAGDLATINSGYILTQIHSRMLEQYKTVCAADKDLPGSFSGCYNNETPEAYLKKRGDLVKQIVNLYTAVMKSKQSAEEFKKNLIGLISNVVTNYLVVNNYLSGVSSVSP